MLALSLILSVICCAQYYICIIALDLGNSGNNEIKMIANLDDRKHQPIVRGTS